MLKAKHAYTQRMKTLFLTVQEFWTEISAIALKWWAWLAWITVAVLARVCYTYSVKQEIKFWGWIAIIGMAYSVGLIIANICRNAGLDDYRGQTISLFSALVADKLLTYVIANWKGIVKHLLNYRPEDKP